MVSFTVWSMTYFCMVVIPRKRNENWAVTLFKKPETRSTVPTFSFECHIQDASMTLCAGLFIVSEGECRRKNSNNWNFDPILEERNHNFGLQIYPMIADRNIYKSFRWLLVITAYSPISYSSALFLEFYWNGNLYFLENTKKPHPVI